MVMSVTCMQIKQIYKFKAKDNISWYNFCLGSVSEDELREISLSGAVYDFYLTKVQ